MTLGTKRRYITAKVFAQKQSPLRKWKRDFHILGIGSKSKSFSVTNTNTMKNVKTRHSWMSKIEILVGPGLLCCSSVRMKPPGEWDPSCGEQEVGEGGGAPIDYVFGSTAGGFGEGATLKGNSRSRNTWYWYGCGLGCSYLFDINQNSKCNHPENKIIQMQVAWQGQTNNNINHYMFNHEKKCRA